MTWPVALLVLAGVAFVGLVLLTVVLWRSESAYRRRLPPDGL